ncbi:MAG: proline/glycine betaine ABC transporter permease [Chloroflexi bacterium]|nr:proline/glycine betaine ABC transporter permease [Chloroflexota bacterium]
MTGEAPPAEGAPATTSLEAIRRRLEFPGLSRGPRWLRWVLWLRWLVVPAILAIVLWAGDWDWAGDFPADVGRDVGREIDNVIDWMTTELDVLFDVIRRVVIEVLVAIEDFLLWLPWPATILAVTTIAWRAAGYWVAAFSAASLTLLAAFGLWDSTMETVALMAVTVTLSIIIAVPLGVWASQSNRLDRILRPILDGMQTMPSFVYLVPAIAFFSLGNVPAVIATLIYAVPPAVRLTNLGIRQLPEETLEAAESFGATPLQLLLKVKIPLAAPTIMAGVNQTTLMALAMVVIASLVGAGGLGEDVNRGLGRIEPGNAFLAGLGIVFLAIIIDRITQAFASRQQSSMGAGGGVG